MDLAGSEDNDMVTMADLLAQEEDFFRVLNPGEIVKGVVASKRPGEILVDVGAKSEGIVDPRDLNNLSPEELAEIKVGETIPVYVVSTQSDEEGHRILLSVSQARVEKDWDEAERLFKAEETIESTVIGNNKGGLIVNFGQVRGFAPGSQLDNAQFGGPHRPDRWSQLTGETLRLKIIEVDRGRNRLILSERAVAEEMRQEREKEKEQFLAELVEGDVLSGRVTGLANFGAFARIGNIEGLIHLSELTDANITHPREVVREGDQVSVRIIRIDPERRRMALSLKEAEGVLEWQEYQQTEDVGDEDETASENNEEEAAPENDVVDD